MHTYIDVVANSLRREDTMNSGTLYLLSAVFPVRAAPAARL
jgi:hypothetical protein